jgi:hypothetical protein
MSSLTLQKAGKILGLVNPRSRGRGVKKSPRLEFQPRRDTLDIMRAA